MKNKYLVPTSLLILTTLFSITTASANLIDTFNYDTILTSNGGSINGTLVIDTTTNLVITSNVLISNADGTSYTFGSVGDSMNEGYGIFTSGDGLINHFGIHDLTTDTVIRLAYFGSNLFNGVTQSLGGQKLQTGLYTTLGIVSAFTDTVVSGSFTETVTAVPLPPTFFMLVSGLLSMFAFRKKANQA